jgi:Ser/Thr protein kinase RdoA (MazF antagonist)
MLLAQAPMTETTFPVIYSMLSCSALVSRVISSYDIGSVDDCCFWNRGLSDIYVIHAQGRKYILRVSHSHWRSRADILFELEFLDFLHTQNIPIAYPLKTNDGQLCLEIEAPEGKRYAALFIYAPGSIPVGDLNERQSANLGATVAQVHQASIGFQSQYQRSPLNLDTLLDEPFAKISAFLGHRPTELSHLFRVISQIKYQLSALQMLPPYWVVCWGDPHSGNAHFTPDNQITLFDFDQCGYGWRAFEIAKFLQISLRAGMGRKIRDAFLQGYQTVQALTDYETASLKSLTQAAHIWVWGISLNHSMLDSYSRLDDSYFMRHLEQLKRLESKDWQLF